MLQDRPAVVSVVWSYTRETPVTYVSRLLGAPACVASKKASEMTEDFQRGVMRDPFLLKLSGKIHSVSHSIL